MRRAVRCRAGPHPAFGPCRARPPGPRRRRRSPGHRSWPGQTRYAEVAGGVGRRSRTRRRGQRVSGTGPVTLRYNQWQDAPVQPTGPGPVDLPVPGRTRPPGRAEGPQMRKPEGDGGATGGAPPRPGCARCGIAPCARGGGPSAGPRGTRQGPGRPVRGPHRRAGPRARAPRPPDGSAPAGGPHPPHGSYCRAAVVLANGDGRAKPRTDATWPPPVRPRRGYGTPCGRRPGEEGGCT